MAKKKNNLVKNASILMAALIISRVIGLLYRRPLGEILGPVGLGYYGYAMNLYTILLLISTFSIPTALSKIVSERLAVKQYKNAHKAFKGALIYGVVVGGAFALIAFFGGAILLPGNQANAIPALKALAPTIFLSAILGVLRGYFQAHKIMTPTSISQIIEQIFNAVISIVAAVILINALAPFGGTDAAIWGSVGGTIGTGGGVLFGLVFMAFVYYVNKKSIDRHVRRDGTEQEESYTDIFKLILIVVTPIIATSFINNASTYLDGVLYANIQGGHGVAADFISTAYGEYCNYYLPLINIPLALAAASVAAMMPEVSSSYALGRIDEVNSHALVTIRMTMFICIPCTIGLTVMAGPIMDVLFPASTELSAKLLLSGSLYVIFAGLSTITSGVLQSIGQQKQAMINAAISLGANLAFQAVILYAAPALDIYTVMIANILFGVVCCILNDISLKKYLGFKNEFMQTYGMPIIASAGMAAAVFFIYRGLHALMGSVLIPLAVGILASILVYIIIYAAVSGVTEEELRRYPMGGKLVKILKLLKIYKDE